MMLREFRKEYGISLQEADKTTGIPLRTYIRYESNDNYGSSIKRNTMIKELVNKYQVAYIAAKYNSYTYYCSGKDVVTRSLGTVTLTYLNNGGETSSLTTQVVNKISTAYRKTNTDSFNNIYNIRIM